MVKNLGLVLFDATHRQTTAMLGNPANTATILPEQLLILLLQPISDRPTGGLLYDDVGDNSDDGKFSLE